MRPSRSSPSASERPPPIEICSAVSNGRSSGSPSFGSFPTFTFTRETEGGSSRRSDRLEIHRNAERLRETRLRHAVEEALEAVGLPDRVPREDQEEDDDREEPQRRESLQERGRRLRRRGRIGHASDAPVQLLRKLAEVVRSGGEEASPDDRLERTSIAVPARTGTPSCPSSVR